MLASRKIKNDIHIKDPQECPTDTVSSISWAPNSNNLTFATSDWASYIRIYDLDPEPSTLTQKACFDAQSPCLSVKWHEDETTLFAGCSDGSVKSFDIASGHCSLIGKHEGPVKSVHWISESNTLLTVSFDETVRFWDPRQAQHIAGYQLNYKPFCSDVLFPHLAIGLSDAKCLIVDLNNAEGELRGQVNYLESQLGARTQLTSIRLFSDAKTGVTGVGISGNDARGNISNFETTQDGRLKLNSRMTFKAHKTYVEGKDTLYPMNVIGFHPHRGSDFVYTTGGEGKMMFWDHKAKNKTVEFDFWGVPVTQAEFDPSGKYLAYSVGYDWARGIQGHMTQPSKIYVHRIQEKELVYGSGGNYPIKYSEDCFDLENSLIEILD